MNFPFFFIRKNKEESGFEFPKIGNMTRFLQAWRMFWSSWLGRDVKEASTRVRLKGEESQVPTSVWNDQLTGQSQRDDGVLVDQGRQRSCREGDSRQRQRYWEHVRGTEEAHPPHPTVHNL